MRVQHEAAGVAETAPRTALVAAKLDTIATVKPHTKKVTLTSLIPKKRRRQAAPSRTAATTVLMAVVAALASSNQCFVQPSTSEGFDRYGTRGTTGQEASRVAIV